MKLAHQTKYEKSLTTSKQNPNESYYQKLCQETDVKYQNITYWKWGKFETVNALDLTPIDLQKALDETEKLLWEHQESIGFTNGNNKDAIHFCKITENNWDVRVPIFTRKEWDGYYYKGQTDTRIVLDTIRLFFDELEWFDMIGFKMTRSDKYNQKS